MSFVATHMIFAGALYDVSDLAGAAEWGSISGTLADQTDLQAALNAKAGSSAPLTALGGVTPAANTFAYFTSPTVAAVTDLTAFARSLLAAPDEVAARTVLGAAIGTDVQAYSAELAAIAALGGTGYAKRTGAGTWVLDAGTSGAAWGGITGTLSTQTDLQAALDAKQNWSSNLTSLAGMSTLVYAMALLTPAGFGVMGLSSYIVTLLNSISNADDARTYLEIENSVPTLGYRAGKYYLPYYGIGSTTLTCVSNRIYYVPMLITSAKTFIKIGVNVASALGTNGRLGIYSNANGIPTTKLLDAGTVSIASTGEKEITISQDLAPGWYWLAFIPDGACAVVADSGANTSSLTRYGMGAATSTNGVDTFAHEAGAGSTLPATAGTLVFETGTAVIPRIWLRC